MIFDKRQISLHFKTIKLFIELFLRSFSFYSTSFHKLICSLLKAQHFHLVHLSLASFYSHIFFVPKLRLRFLHCNRLLTKFVSPLFVAPDLSDPLTCCGPSFLILVSTSLTT